MNRVLLVGTCVAALAAASAHAGLLSPDNWEECILDRMPGVQNNVAAYAVARTCTKDFGGPSSTSAEQPGMFARYGSGDVCIVEKSKGTVSVSGAQMISAACHRLYDRKPSNPFE